ncbi:hypothetical protein CTI12_AA620450 [Artemisia annua]|uniref:Uncharacterized protein n=1 Tax=Artemisia annua TaxID=35608 RepID=A0A2U1KC03_ARTAN|nr:hypothetical protein CTI12_AA620450 [Artemisia annua]
MEGQYSKDEVPVKSKQAFRVENIVASSTSPLLEPILDDEKAAGSCDNDTNGATALEATETTLDDDPLSSNVLSKVAAVSDGIETNVAAGMSKETTCLDRDNGGSRIINPVIMETNAPAD